MLCKCVLNDAPESCLLRSSFVLDGFFDLFLQLLQCQIRNELNVSIILLKLFSRSLAFPELCLRFLGFSRFFVNFRQLCQLRIQVLDRLLLEVAVARSVGEVSAAFDSAAIQWVGQVVGSVELLAFSSAGTSRGLLVLASSDQVLPNVSLTSEIYC